jgi:hypothetical protein
VFELAKAVHALDRMAAVIGNQLSIDIYIFIYSVDENKSVL